MRRWNCGRGIGICALALGLGILVAAIFPVGCLMFIVAFLLIACGISCLRHFAGDPALLILCEGIVEPYLS